MKRSIAIIIWIRCINLTICSHVAFFKKIINEIIRKWLLNNYQNVSTLVRTNYELLSKITNLFRLLITINSPKTVNLLIVHYMYKSTCDDGQKTYSSFYDIKKFDILCTFYQLKCYSIRFFYLMYSKMNQTRENFACSLFKSLLKY